MNESFSAIYEAVQQESARFWIEHHLVWVTAISSVWNIEEWYVFMKCSKKYIILLECSEIKVNISKNINGLIKKYLKCTYCPPDRYGSSMGEKKALGEYDQLDSSIF